MILQNEVKDLKVVAPDKEEFTLKFGERKILKYHFENIGDYTIRDFDIAVRTMKEQYTDKDDWIPTKNNFAKVQAPPNVLLAHTKAIVNVVVDVPKWEDYRELAGSSDKIIKKLKVPFRINMITMAGQFVERL